MNITYKSITFHLNGEVLWCAFLVALLFGAYFGTLLVVEGIIQSSRIFYSLRDSFRELRDDFNHWKWFACHECVLPKSIFGQLDFYLQDKIRFGALCLKCRIFGHVWEVESDIGTESGCEDFRCTCCGFSQHVIWY